MLPQSRGRIWEAKGGRFGGAVSVGATIVSPVGGISETVCGREWVNNG